MMDVSVLRRLVRGLVFVPVVASIFGLTGCGGTDQSTGPVAPAPTIDQANKNMEDFMKTQGKGAPKK